MSSFDETVVIDSFVSGYNATYGTVASVLPDSLETAVVRKGVWITNLSATTNMLMDIRRSPTSTYACRVPPGATVFIPVKRPHDILVRAQTGTVPITWVGI